MPPSPKLYKTTFHGVSEWAKSELEHVGRIATVQDPDLQYSYALSTVNGMLHLRNAIYELYKDPNYASQKTELYRLYFGVQRALQHLITEYRVNKKTLENFNTRKVLGDLDDLKWTVSKPKSVLDGGRKVSRKTGGKAGRKTRKAQRKTRGLAWSN